MGTDTYSAPRLVTLMQSWIAGGAASLGIASSRIHLDPTCNTSLDTLKSPDCPVGRTGPATRGPLNKPTGSSSPNIRVSGVASVGEIGGIAVGVVIIALLAVIVVFIVVLMIRKWRPSFSNR